jgi:hypothetical protein
MNIIYDDFLNNNCTYTIVTTCNSFNKYGELVMGKGAALAFKKKYPESNVFSSLVKQKMDSSGYYGFIRHGNLGIFQVKYDFKNPAYLELIEQSALELTKFAKSHKNWTFAMNFPGIGAGELGPDDVMSIVSKLPDNVFLYIRE